MRGIHASTDDEVHEAGLFERVVGKVAALVAIAAAAGIGILMVRLFLGNTY